MTPRKLRVDKYMSLMLAPAESRIFSMPYTKSIFTCVEDAMIFIAYIARLNQATEPTGLLSEG
jgi:hypothetical protein